MRIHLRCISSVAIIIVAITILINLENIFCPPLDRSSTECRANSANDVTQYSIESLTVNTREDNGSHTNQSSNNGQENFVYPEPTPLRPVECSIETKIRVPLPHIQYVRRWLPIGRAPKANYVYSAYYDDRFGKHGIIRMFGLAWANRQVGKFCQMWYSAHALQTGSYTNKVYVVPLIQRRLGLEPEPETFKFESVTYICLVPSSEIPYAVSLVRNECDLPFNMLRVYHTTLEVDRESFALCIQTPLNNDYNDPLQMTEMMEYNLIFKAQKIVIYNHTSGPAVQDVLNTYKGNVSVNQWILPNEVLNGGITNLARDICINDCLYRMMSYVRYVAFTELDELYVPRLHQQWRIFVESMPSWSRDDQTSPIASFYFNKVVFPTQQVDNTELLKNFSYIKHLRPYSLLKLDREDKIYAGSEHNKFLVLARGIELVDIHKVHRMIKGFSEYFVPDEIGLVHKYNSSELPKSSNRITDKTMFMYGDELVPGMLDRLTNQTHTVSIPEELLAGNSTSGD